MWVRPAAAAAAGKTADNAEEEWVKATVARVLDGGATLEVVLEGSSEETPATISVSAADAPLQNPASRLGVEVRKRESEREKRRGDEIDRARKRREGEEKKQGAPFFSLERRERPFAVFLLSLLLLAA